MIGKKQCPFCKKLNGSRSKNCIQCGKGFIISKIRQRDIDPKELIVNKSKNDTEAAIKLSSLFILSEPRDVDIKYYGKTFQCWLSVCQQYRICYAKELLGVDVEGLPYKLLYKSGDDWIPISGESRFRTFRKAIKVYLRLVNKTHKVDKNKHPLLDKALRKMKLAGKKRVKR